MNNSFTYSSVTHQTVLKTAIPIMLANLSTPMLGIVDTAVVGQIPSPIHIGAVAIGTTIFSFLFWAFGFLRMGTTGLTAQAIGGARDSEVKLNLWRALALAIVIGIFLVLVKKPIAAAAFWLLSASNDVEKIAASYFEIRIWAAPATLANYVLLGWFIGMGKTRRALALQITLNTTNIILDWLFVMKMGMGVDGVALGTLIAEFFALSIGGFWAFQEMKRLGFAFPSSQLLATKPLLKTLIVSRDILIRSLLLIFIFAWFTSQGAQQGDVVLAANAILMHFILVTAYFLDGFALAAEVLVGHSVGFGSRRTCLRAMTLSTGWAVATAFVCTILLLVFSADIVNILTVEESVRNMCANFSSWAVTAPIVAVWCYQLDGIFIGATWTQQMRKAMLFSTFVYICAWHLLTPLGNHGLWAALHVAFAVRFLSLLFYLPGLIKNIPEK